MTDPRPEVVVDAELEAPPETVWRALSDPVLGARWLPPEGVRTTPGERFSVEDDGRRIDCEVLEADPPRRLRLAWSEADGSIASEVTFTLTPTPAGARLEIVHGAIVARLAPRRTAEARAGAPGAFDLRMAA